VKITGEVEVTKVFFYCMVHFLDFACHSLEYMKNRCILACNAGIVLFTAEGQKFFNRLMQSYSDIQFACSAQVSPPGGTSPCSIFSYFGADPPDKTVSFYHNVRSKSMVRYSAKKQVRYLAVKEISSASTKRKKWLGV